MILITFYLTMLAMFFLNISTLFTSVFSSLGISAGMKSIFIQIVALILATIILVFKKKHTKLINELIKLCLVWLPFLTYLAFRTDMGDDYSELKFWKFVVTIFFSAFTLVIVYLADIKKFTSIIFPVIVFFGALLIGKAILDPQVFIYATVVERLTVDAVNPVWLARSFSMAALCVLFLPIKSKIIKLLGFGLFIYWIIPTGSRGPLISLFLVLGVRWILLGEVFKIKTVMVRISIVASILAITVVTMGVITQSYLSRGTDKNVFEESGRVMLFTKALNEFKTSPIVGTGLGKYSRTSKSTLVKSNKGYYPHNILLEVLSELGGIGFILYIITFRFGAWVFDIKNKFNCMFLLTLLFSMTSGDLNANAGVVFFAVLARLSHIYAEDSMNVKDSK